MGFVSLFHYTDIGESLCTVPGLHHERAKETHPRSKIADVPTSPCPPLDTRGVRILTLHLNYVAGYTSPLLFLFERTHHYYVENQGLVPWRLRRLGRSKVPSASSVKVLSDG